MVSTPLNAVNYLAGGGILPGIVPFAWWPSEPTHKEHPKRWQQLADPHSPRELAVIDDSSSQ